MSGGLAAVARFLAGHSPVEVVVDAGGDVVGVSAPLGEPLEHEYDAERDEHSSGYP